MEYNLANNADAGKALALLLDLTRDGKLIELRQVSPKRTLSQNRYLHLLLGAWGMHHGYNLEEAKMIYKGINHGLYHYEKNGRRFIRSSADLTKEDMSKSIDRFREWSAEHGLELPLATNQEWLRQIANEMERSKYYL